MTALRIALADLAYINETNRHNLYTPLNVGYVAAYTKQRFGAAVDITVYKDPVRLLEDHRRAPFQIVGIAEYYWKRQLNEFVAGKLKASPNPPLIIVGGPSIDSDHVTQERYLLLHPHYDAIVPNEGEVAFGNFVERVLGFLSPGHQISTGPIAGVVARTPGGEVVHGAFINLATDLSTIPSPYLTGWMDEWLGGEWQPLVQTARLCPYTCAFCVSGKDRGKLRAFEVEHVVAEFDYIAQRFRGPRDSLFYLVDENFGILERDIAIADGLLRIQRDRGYPNRVYFYNDKRFTHIARSVHERVGKMVWHGVCLSLQSENKDALKAANRRNLTDEQVAAALAWAKGLGFKTSTELIFGLPGERLDTYCATVDKCARLGFEAINSYGLILFDGIEMDRPAYRKAHGIKTVQRRIRGSHAVIEGEAIHETEEAVVASNSFTEQDFMQVRIINIMLKMIYALRREPDFFEDLVASGASLSGFILHFANPGAAWIDHPAERALVVRLRMCAMLGHDPEDPEQANIFLPPEAWDSVPLRAMLERARSAWRNHDEDPPDRRQGAEQVLQPRAN
jgi:radical SAM superfamily enzyme YgiQ (UPF0313 family)